MNIYLWYDKINEIIISRKNHIGPYVGLAAGFLGGLIYTFSTPTSGYYTDFWSGKQIPYTTYFNWWTVFPGAAIGAIIGLVVETAVKKKIRMKINHNHNEFLKYKPMLEEYLKK